MKFIDVHWHSLLTKQNLQSAIVCLDNLRQEGLTAAVVCVLDDLNVELEVMEQVMPPFVWQWLEKNDTNRMPHTNALLNTNPAVTLLPYIDIRCARTPEDFDLPALAQNGFKGLKLLYVPDGDQAARIQSVPRALGISKELFRQNYHEAVGQAAALGWPVLLHLDLNQYEEFGRQLLEDNPGTAINIAHLGYSRRLMDSLLQDFPHCYTDLSALAPFIRAKPEGYRDFIQRHPQQVLWGSDWNLPSDPGLLMDTLQILEVMGLCQAEKEMLVNVNPRRYLGKYGV